MFEESLFFDRPFTEKAPDQLHSDLLCFLRSLFHAYLNPTLQKRGGVDSDPQPLFLCHVVCGLPSRSLTPNFNTLTNEQE